MRWLPLVLLLAACGTEPTTGPREAGGERCPARAGLSVPAEPTADTLGRLVPQEPPTAVLVCRYAPLRQGERAASLAQEVALTAGLEAVPADLLLPGREGQGQESASCGSAPGPVTPLLVRLTYDDGVVWLSATEQPDPCRGTTNGRFRTGEDVGDVLVASAAARAWTLPPLPDAEQRCVPQRAGRRGQETALLPAGVRSLVLCRVAGDGVSRRTATAQELATVQDVLAQPVAELRPRACRGGAEQYELAAAYGEGPVVLVRYSPGCDPQVDNGALRADLEPDDRARLEAVLGGL